MTLQLRRRNSVWTVFCDQKPVAEIHLDYLHQVDDVMLYAETATEIQLQVLRLAAHHVQKFVIDRRITLWGGLLQAEYGNKSRSTITLSDHTMNFAEVSSEIRGLDRDRIVKELRAVRIGVTVAIHRTAEEAIIDAVSRVGVPGLSYRKTEQYMALDNEMTILFTVGQPHRFTFWKCEGMPTGQRHDLHIVPSYHPVMQGWKTVGMVNGDTDAYIRGEAVRRIYCPRAALSNRHAKNFGASWSHLKHPYCAVGRSMGIRLIATKLRSEEGVEELAQVLRASLGLREQYIPISGGFRSPVQPLRRMPHVRGSEAHCVWTYHTLEKEGFLAQAYIPAWFTAERWLDLYQKT